MKEWQRDPTLNPKIDPPACADVRERFPGAVEQLEAWDDRGQLELSEDGTFLIFTSDTPCDDIVWGLKGRKVWTDWDGEPVPGQKEEGS